MAEGIIMSDDSLCGIFWLFLLRELHVDFTSIF